jgi:aryl-alcohol dehydrogenase-like predicted oxidoreductase
VSDTNRILIFKLDISKLKTHEKDVTSAQVALSWLFHKGAVPIIGATKVEHVEAAVDSLDVRLTNDDMNQLEAPYRPHARARVFHRAQRSR